MTRTICRYRRLQKHYLRKLISERERRRTQSSHRMHIVQERTHQIGCTNKRTYTLEVYNTRACHGGAFQLRLLQGQRRPASVLRCTSRPPVARTDLLVPLDQLAQALISPCLGQLATGGLAAGARQILSAGRYGTSGAPAPGFWCRLLPAVGAASGAA